MYRVTIKTKSGVTVYRVFPLSLAQDKAREALLIAGFISATIEG